MCGWRGIALGVARQVACGILQSVTGCVLIARVGMSCGCVMLEASGPLRGEPLSAFPDVSCVWRSRGAGGRYRVVLPRRAAEEALPPVAPALALQSAAWVAAECIFSLRASRRVSVLVQPRPHALHGGLGFDSDLANQCRLLVSKQVAG